MARFSIFNSSGQYVGEVYSGGSDPRNPICHVAESVLIPTLILFSIYIANSTGAHVPVFSELSMSHIPPTFPALAAACGTVVFGCLFASAWNFDIASKTLKATVFCLVLTLSTGISELIGSPIARLLPVSISWVIVGWFIALGAVPALFTRYVLMRIWIVSDESGGWLLMIYLSGVLFAFLFHTLFPFWKSWPSDLWYRLTGKVL